MKNYYDILGVQKTASEDEIKTAFRKLAQRYHPDKKGGDEARFKEVSEAYAVLSDKKRRAEYDTYGRTFAGSGQPGFGGFDFSNFQDFQNGNFQGGNFQEFDLGDIFGEFFGGGAGGRNRRGRDVSIDIELTFREAVFGTNRRVLIAKVGTCDTCSGSGAKPGTKMSSCTSCNGKGEIRETRNTFFGNFTSSRMCPRCNGKGQVPESPCEACNGAGVRKREEEIQITVPAGVDNGEMIRMPGRGEAAAGGASGDMYVKLHVKEEKNYVRDGHNLVTVLPIKLTDALLGGEYRIPTLDGDEKIAVPAGVPHGEIIKVRGKGVPHGRGRGDLLVRVEIEFPKKLSKSQKELIEKLRGEGL